MDIIKCTLDDKIYKVSDFEQLEESDLAKKRRFLECNKCGGMGFFRKASKSGQGACFGARPHLDNCDFSSHENDNINGDLTKEYKELINSDKEIVLDFEYGTVKNQHVVEIENNAISKNNNGGKYSSQNGTAESSIYRRLSTLLRNLVYQEDFFKDSKQRITFNKYTYHAGNFFIQASYITQDYFQKINERSYRAVWSMISHANSTDEKTFWINTGGNNKFSILIDNQVHDDFIERFKVNELEDLSGKYILVISQLKNSSNNKIYSIPKDISYITVI